MSPKIAPINYAYLAAWERKCPRSSKTWECVTKTQQANKLGPARSSRGLEMQRVPAEGQKCDASCPTWESFLWDTSGPECPRRWPLGVTAVGVMSLRNKTQIRGIGSGVQIPAIVSQFVRMRAFLRQARRCKNWCKGTSCNDFRPTAQENPSMHTWIVYARVGRSLRTGREKQNKTKKDCRGSVCTPVFLSIKLGVWPNQNEWLFNDRARFLQRHARVYLSR